MGASGLRSIVFDIKGVVVMPLTASESVLVIGTVDDESETQPKCPRTDVYTLVP